MGLCRECLTKPSKPEPPPLAWARRFFPPHSRKWNPVTSLSVGSWEIIESSNLSYLSLQIYLVISSVRPGITCLGSEAWVLDVLLQSLLALYPRCYKIDLVH